MRSTRAFTVIEMALALLLAAFVVLTALTLTGMVDRAERVLSARASDMQELANCHATLRRAIQSLVAVAADGGPARRVEAQPTDGRSELAQEMFGDRPLAEQLGLRDSPEGPGPIKHLRVGPLDPDARPGPDESIPWRLELVLTQQPVALAPARDGPIRGAFDKMPDGPDWAFVWTPLDPPGEPVILADRLAEVFMAVLDRDSAWTDVLEARKVDEFPRAVRVVLWARSGATTDWLFEPGVTIGDAPGENARRAALAPQEEEVNIDSAAMSESGETKGRDQKSGGRKPSDEDEPKSRRKPDRKSGEKERPR